MEKIFSRMLRTMIKGWHLCCYKCLHRNLNVYSNIYSRETSFLFRGNSNDPFSSLKSSKHSKTDSSMKLTKKSGNYCKYFGLGTKFQKHVCEHSHWHNSPSMCERSHWNNPLPLFACICILMDPPPPPKCQCNNLMTT